GTYYVKINEFGNNGTIPLYILDVQTFVSLTLGTTCDPNFDLCDPSANLVCGSGNTCEVLSIDRSNYEQFSSSDQDIANTTITYVPASGTYGPIASAATVYPDTPGSAPTTATLTITED